MKSKLKLRQQEPDEARQEMSSALAYLAAVYDADKAMFEAKFGKFRRELSAMCVLMGTPELRFRHVVLSNGRQRFLVTRSGQQWDYFEFDIAESHGDPDALRAMLGAIDLQLRM